MESFLDDPDRQNDDGTTDLFRCAGIGEVEAKPLLLFKTFKQADTFMALWGTQHQPMKQKPGQNPSRRVYVCRHPMFSQSGSGYLKRSAAESSGGAESSSASAYGKCDAFFLFQKVRAQSLVDGTWHRSQYSRLAYGSGCQGCGSEDDDDGASEAGGGDVTKPAAPKEKSSTPPKRRSNSIANHKYPVPQLKQLPPGCARNDRVIALTCFKAHIDHPSEVFSSEIGSTSTNTQNVPGSAGALGQNNTCRCVRPLIGGATPLHVLHALRARGAPSMHDASPSQACPVGESAGEAVGEALPRDRRRLEQTEDGR